MRAALCVIEDVIWGVIFVCFVLGGVVWHVATEGFFEFAPATPEDIQRMVTDAVKTSFRLAAFEEAFTDDDIEGVELLVQAAELVGIPVPQAVQDRYAAENTAWKTSQRFVKKCGKGFVLDEGEGLVGMGCSLASDMTMLGDLRDVAAESYKIAEGKEPDKLVLGLAVAGLALEAGGAVTGGTSVGVKVGTSLMKTGVKTATVSRRLMHEVGRLVSSAINTKPLKSLTLSDAMNMPKIRAVASEAVDLRRVEPVIEAAGTLRKIEQRGKRVDAIMVLKTAESLDDIKSAEKVSAVFMGKTGAVLKVIGRKAYDFTGFVFKAVVNMTWWMASLVIWAISGVLGGFLWLFSTVRLVKLAVGAVRGRRQTAEGAVAS